MTGCKGYPPFWRLVTGRPISTNGFRWEIWAMASDAIRLREMVAYRSFKSKNFSGSWSNTKEKYRCRNCTYKKVPVCWKVMSDKGQKIIPR
ncbi:MAG: hypothetical protein R2788_08950 [Saprospiraceae bacterium]